MEIAGIDADSIVSQLMQIERRPLVALQARRDAAKVAIDAIGRIRTKVDAFRLAADRLSLRSSFDRHSTQVSAPDAMAARITGTSSVGSLSFTVDQLAQAHGLRSVGTIASDAIAVTNEPLIAVAGGTRPLGIATVRAGAGLAAGAVEVAVVQSSASAKVIGVVPAAASTVIDGSNNSFDVVIDGIARSVTIAPGTYDPASLAAAVQSAIDAAGGGATASLDGGAIALATTREGSAASIQVTGGSALGALGLAVDASAHVGTDGIIDVGGTTTTVASATAGTAVSVDTGAGILEVTLSGGLRVGDADVAVVSTGDRSLAAVAAAITGAGAGVNAAAVKVANGAWRLQLTSTRTGDAARIAIDESVFVGLGGMIESSAARNARITIGSGPGAYSVEATGNTFTDVMPGVTLTAKSVSTNPVTVSVNRDDAAIADDVGKMISAINDVLAELKVQTRTDPTAGTSGPLAGNSTIRRLADQLRSALADAVPGLGTSLPSSVGIARTREGSFTFDRDRLLGALADDPAAVARLFARGGTTTGDAVFAVADGLTARGSYAVEVTTPATRATSALLFDGGAAAGTRVGVRIGQTTATVDVQAGQTTGQIVDDLNEAFAASGLGLVAEIDGTGLRIRSDAWGVAGSFELNTDVNGAGTWDATTGTDVAGTIAGLVANGSGRRLTLPASATSPAAGLGVDVAAGVTGALGPVEYNPGIAARVVAVTSALTRVETGALTTAKEFAQGRIDDFRGQIDRLEDRLLTRELNMRRQWANMQTLLSSLQNQGSWLGGQLASLSNTNWGPN